MSPYTEGLYQRFISCLEENKVKHTVTPKGNMTVVDFKVNEDDELLSELSEIAGVDPDPIRGGSTHRVCFF